MCASSDVLDAFEKFEEAARSRLECWRRLRLPSRLACRGLSDCDRRNRSGEIRIVGGQMEIMECRHVRDLLGRGGWERERPLRYCWRRVLESAMVDG
jgi:hypothetical protein